MALEPLSDDLVQWFAQRTYDASDIKGRKIAIYSDQGVGKTKLAAELGESNLFVTDEEGILSLLDWPDLHAKSTGITFDGNDKRKNGIGYERLAMICRACENGQYIGKNGKPIDNLVFDTVSGIVGTEIRRIVKDRDIPTEKGQLSSDLATRATYFLSEQNFAPIAQMTAQMHNCSVTFLSHLRVGTKDTPGASTRPDVHGAVYRLMAKYVSVMGYMHMGGPTGRQIRVMPGDMTAAKTRVNFGKNILSDEEFIAKIAKWKAGQK